MAKHTLKILRWGYYKIRFIFGKMDICKKDHNSNIFLKKDNPSVKSINKLFQNVVVFFTVSLIKHSLKTIATEGHFVLPDNLLSC